MNKIQKARREASKQIGKVQPKRMSYETYAYLKCLVNDQKKKLERNFQTACDYIPLGFSIKGISAMDKAHEVFRKHYAELNAIEEELHAAAQSMYKDHPNPEMRAFWGLPPFET